MKKILITLLGLTSLMLYSQDTPGFEVPNYAAKSPEAASFLKYGEYPVDLSTGLPKVSIPLYTIALKDYQMPITLDYHASGIKVKQEASWVGLGWNVNYGAQIILDVRDGVDQNNPYIDTPITQANIDYYTTNNDAYNSGPILGGDNEKNSSRVRDVFRFSSPTASGTFIITSYQNNEVMVFPPDAFKVQVTGGRNSNFVITDPSGNKYKFTTTKEISYRELTHHDNYISAWYVDEIETPNNEKINFTYVDDGELIEYNITQRHEIKERRKWSTITYMVTDYEYTTNLKGDRGSTMTQSKKISEISFNDGASKILFKKLSGRLDLENANSRLNILEIRHNGALINGYSFNYNYFNSAASSFVSKRLKLNSIETLIEGVRHEFVYNEDIPLPDKGNYSYSQDLYGYFNNESNTNLIPVTEIDPPFNTTVGGADRSVNTAVNQTGMLKEIHYPTKGWTKFSYENNNYVGTITNTVGNYYNGVVQGEGSPQVVPPEYTPCPGEENECPCSEPGQCIKYQYIYFTVNNPSTFSVSVNINDATPVGSIPNHHQHGRVRVYKTGTVLYDSSERYLDWTDAETFSNVATGNWCLLIESYGDKINTMASVTVSHTQSGPGNKLGGGQRIKSIENYDSNDALLTKTNYDYTDPNTGLTSGKEIPGYPINFIHPGTTDFYFSGGYLVMTKIHYIVASYTRFGTEGNTTAYEYVKEEKVDVTGNSHNGYTLYKFNTEGDAYAEPSTLLYTPWMRGKLLEKKVFRKRFPSPGADPVYDLLQTEENVYNEDYSKVAIINGFKLKRYTSVNLEQDFGYTDWGVPSSVSQAVDFITYSRTVPWTYLKKTISTSYFYDNLYAPTGSLTSATTFNYNNPDHLQLSSKVTTNSKGETVENKYYYPGDSEVTLEPFVTTLVQKNRINIPLIAQTYLGGDKTYEQKTVYNDWGDNIIKPQLMRGAKEGSPLENRIRFIDYDEKGNPLELQMEEGMHVCYVWGYNKTLVLAKIENIQYNQIPPALITALQNASDVSITGDETALTTAIANLRNNSALASAMVTTYIYQPLIGVKRITDPRDYTTTFEYDTEGRLRFVKDQSGNILSENQYHYKN